MKSLKKIIAVCLVFVTSFCVFPVIAFADGEGNTYTGYSFWGWVLDGDTPDWLDSIVGFVSPDYCEDSPTHFHTASSYLRKTNFFEQLGSFGTFDYECQCQYCGDTFYVNEKNVAEFCREAYGTPATGDAEATGFLSTLPVPQINMSGKLLWSPSELTQIRFGYKTIYNLSGPVDFSVVTATFPSGFPYSDSSFQVYPTTGDSLPSWPHLDFSFSGIIPVDGFYTYVTNSCAVSYKTTSTSLNVSSGSDIGECISSTPQGILRAGDSVSYKVDASRNLDDYSNYALFEALYFSFPLFEITPLSSLLDGNLYSPETRAAFFTGDIGIIGDDGQLIKVEGDQIFNETTNNYYNPTTGETSTVTDWYYDYSDRSYHLTTEEGDKVTVTYGDENITVQEGDTTYNVYYITYGEVEDPCTDGKPHEWSVTDTTPATCTMAGSETQTCSKCGKTKTTTLPVLGHKWKVKQSVTTKYDENGELLQEGYTIYECERCGEEYKDTGSTGPPPTTPGGGSSGGDSGGGDSLWDSIVEFFKNIAASFASLPEWFSRFSEFLSSAFSYLPKEIVLLLTFGVFAVVGIGIWKAVRR